MQNGIILVGHALLIWMRMLASFRIAAIQAFDLLHLAANVRFGEAAPQRPAQRRMAALGRSRQSTPRADCGHSLRALWHAVDLPKADAHPQPLMPSQLEKK